MPIATLGTPALFPDGGLIEQPLDAIQQYFGSSFAFYFAWVEVVTQWLFCLGCALSVLAWQQVVNAVAYFFGDVEQGTPYGTSQGGLVKFKTMFGNGNVEYTPGVAKSSTFEERLCQKTVQTGRRSLARHNSQKLPSAAGMAGPPQIRRGASM